MYDSVMSGAVIYTANCDRLAAFYVAVIGLRECERKPDYVVLEDANVQLVLLRADDAAHAASASAAALARPVDAGQAPRRSEAAIKPVFRVASIEVARAAAASAGGRINSARHEWRFGAHRVCDGLDPDGNVIQLREMWSPTTPSRS
jgi:predicted enzyme related to lactoylglutathione lyase